MLCIRHAIIWDVATGEQKIGSYGPDCGESGNRGLSAEKTVLQGLQLQC